MKLFAFLLALLAASVAFAHSEMETPEDVIGRIMARQSAPGQLDCNAVADADFEMLGDAVMGRMAGHELHEQMDAMMGGEGSVSLQQMHVAMGRKWLGCQGMMPGAMMPMMMRMMGNYYPGYYSGYDAVLVLAAVGWILFFVMLYLYLSRMSKKRR